MPGSARWVWVAGLSLVACGGRYQTEGDEGRGNEAGTTRSGGGSTAMGGTGGSTPRPSEGGSGAMPSEGGSGAVPSEGGSGAVPSEGGVGAVASGGVPTCSSLPAECSTSSDIVYVGGVELRYPAAGSCGECTSTCVECEIFCKLPIKVTPRCTGSNVHLSVCSTPDGQGACLNTLVEKPYYVDDLGKRWSIVSLEPDDPMQFLRVGTVMASLTLNVTDGVALKVLQVAVLACNTERTYVLPC